jgi:putative membrane protein
LLRAGLPLLVFPEGYPNVDPSYTPKTDDDEFLPFRPGFIRFVALAERDGLTRVPIVPVGLEYRRGDRWRLTIRFGPPITFAPGVDKDERVLAIEEQVRRLSSSPDGPRWSLTRFSRSERPQRKQAIVGSVPCVRLLRFENGEWE